MLKGKQKEIYEYVAKELKRNPSQPVWLTHILNDLADPNVEGLWNKAKVLFKGLAYIFAISMLIYRGFLIEHRHAHDFTYTLGDPVHIVKQKYKRKFWKSR